MYKYIFLCISLFLLASCTPSATDTTSSKNLPQSTVASPTFGSGKHTLTIFADFQCPACIAFANAINPIIEEYAQKGHVTITYKQFPLTSIHKNAERDAIAALCSVEQGKYMEYKKALYAMEQGKSGAKVSDEDRVAAAKDILDTAKLTECLRGDRYLGQVRAEMKEAESLGVNGTPTVFLDGKKLDNSVFRDPVIFRSLLDRWLEVPQTASGSVK